MINVNEYFNGTVKSLGYITAEGQSTIGVLEPGAYEFGTSSHETMTIIEGQLDAQPGQTEWQTYVPGQSFEVEANTRFQVKTSVQSSYLCKYR